MVITDPNLISQLQTGAADPPRLEVEAVSKKGSSNSGQAPVQNPSIQSGTTQPVSGSLTVDEQQAVRQVIQSLGVSAKLLDQLTAALGGTAEPVPATVKLPQNAKSDTLEAATIRLLTGEFLNLQSPEIAAAAGQSGRASSLQDASAAAARQILASLKLAEKDSAGKVSAEKNSTAPPLETNRTLAEPGRSNPSQTHSQPDQLNQSPSAQNLPGLSQPNQVLLSQSKPPKSQMGTTAAGQTQPLQLQLQIPTQPQAVAELAIELNNLLQTTLWLRSIDQPAGQSINLSAAPSGSAAAFRSESAALREISTAPQADSILRLLTVLQLTGTPDSAAASTSAETFEKAVSRALTGGTPSGAAAGPDQQSTIAALLADPDGAELVATIGRSIDVVNRLLERTAPEDTDQLRQTLRDLGAALSRLAPPPALNPTAVRTPPPEPVRQQVAQLLTAARIEIEVLVNPDSAKITTQAATTPVSQQPPRPAAAPAESSAGRLSELLTTIEKRGLDLVLHQISSLNGHEKWLSEMQLSLEQDSLAATALQTVKLLEKSLSKADLPNSADPKLAQLKEALLSIEKVLADSLAKGTAPAPEKIEAALLNLTRLTAGSIDQARPAGSSAPLPLTKLQIAMASLLEQQLTGLRLYSTGSPGQPVFRPVPLAPVFDPLTGAGIQNTADPISLLRLFNQPAAARNVLPQAPLPLPLDLQNSKQSTAPENLPGRDPIRSGAGPVREDMVRDDLGRDQRSAANLQSREPTQSAGQQSAQNAGANRQTSGLVNDQVRALANSLSLQLDLLAEQADIPATGAGRPGITAPSHSSTAGQHLFSSGFNSERTGSTQSGSTPSGAGLASVSAGFETEVRDPNTLIQTSVLGPRINSILAKIDQLRQSHLAGGESTAAHTADGKLLDVLQQTARRLQDRAASSDQPLNNADLRQAVDKLEMVFREVTSTTRPPAATGSAAEAIRQIETLIRGQEALSYLNPVMQALGEPTFILFPAVIHGMMIRIEMMLYPHVDPDGGSGSKKKQKQDKSQEETGDPGPDGEKRREAAEKHSFRRLKVGLSMPNLGRVAVDFAHTLQEALIGIAVEDNGAAAQLEAALPELKRTFNSLGYSNVDLSIKSDPAGDLQPAWLQELLRVNAVAA